MIQLEHISKIYKPSADVSVAALNDISLTIKTGEFVALLGPSGCGKSTLLYIIGLLEKPTNGKVIINDKDTVTLSDTTLSRIRGKTIGFIFQQFNLIPKMTILENVVLPVFYSSHHSLPEARKKGLELLTQFGIGNKADVRPNQLSGGQQQRVAIARALINNPDIIIADEPTGNLDSTNGKQIIELIDSIHKREKKTIILVTHDATIASFAKRVVRLVDGRIVHG